MIVGSTFSGIGGLDLAFERAGARVIWTSEVDPAACRVLAHRFPHAEPLGSIVDLVDGMFGPPPVDVLIGGPPCQDLSTANASGRAGLDGARSGLFHAYAAVLGMTGARFAVMEQVPGLLTANDGADLATVTRTFGDLGYRFAYTERNTRDYGPPQSRRRLTFLLVRDDQPVDPLDLLRMADPHPTTVCDLDAAIEWQATEVDPAAIIDPSTATGILDRLARPGGAAPTELVRALGDAAQGAPTLDAAPAAWRKSTRARSAEVGETWVPATYANTLTLNDVGAARATMLIVDRLGRLRTLTAVEAERLHGLPDGWTDPAGSYRHRMARLGNAVSVPVAQAIANAIVQREAIAA
jgi:DNA-cytosine methyltransferase